MVDISRAIDILFIISFWEISGKLIKKLKQHRHKWLNLGTDPEQWHIHLEANIKGLKENQFREMLEVYTHGRYCLKCEEYHFEKRVNGEIKQRLSFSTFTVRMQ